MLPKEGQQFVNDINETSLDYDSITADFATFKDLGTAKVYNHISIQSTLNNPITLNFASGNTITLSNESFVLDNLNHNDVIQIKHNGSAPTTGSIKMRNW